LPQSPGYLTGGICFYDTSSPPHYICPPPQ
jgi:hypothetical protein